MKRELKAKKLAASMRANFGTYAAAARECGLAPGSLRNILVAARTSPETMSKMAKGGLDISELTATKPAARHLDDYRGKKSPWDTAPARTAAEIDAIATRILAGQPTGELVPRVDRDGDLVTISSGKESYRRRTWPDAPRTVGV